MLSGDNIRQGSKEQRDKDEKGKKHKEEKKHKTGASPQSATSSSPGYWFPCGSISCWRSFRGNCTMCSSQRNSSASVKQS